MEDFCARRLVFFASAWGMMSCAVVAQPADEPRVARLVRTLGADDFDARRRADLELLKLGPESLRQLEAAAQSTDLEVRLRALNLLERIAAVQLWEPTRVSVLTRGKVSELLAQCARGTGNHIRTGSQFGDLEDMVLQAEYSEEIYWRVVDDLAARSNNHLRMHYDHRTPGIVVTSGAPGKFPTAYAGPLRIQITSARRSFTDEFDYEQLSSESSHTFQLNLQMLWEDRFRLAAYRGQPEVVEVVAGNGTRLVGATTSGDNWNVASESPRHVNASIRISPPPVVAKTLSLLRLRWELVALGQISTIELPNPAEGAELYQDGISIQVSKYRTEPTGRTDLTLVVAREIPAPDPAEIQFHENTMELVDANNKPLRLQDQNHSTTDRGVEYRLVFMPQGSFEGPVKLRVNYPKFRSRRDLEIVFKDVPLPVGSLD